jgi:hypothetical protein
MTLSETTAEGAPRRRARRGTLLPFVLGALLLAALLAVFLLRERTPQLTREIYERQLQTWARAGWTDYELALSVALAGADEKRYRLTVRDNEVVSFEIDGVTLRGGDAYTIFGLFDMLERELELAAEDSQQQGAPANADVRARFNAEHGYPEVLIRLASQNRSFFIRVENVTPLRAT